MKHCIKHTSNTYSKYSHYSPQALEAFWFLLDQATLHNNSYTFNYVTIRVCITQFRLHCFS